ncbi:MFS transporter [Arthrobacter sp. 260]|uniref:MFS transporter n=1 Tax=Arthrobacter sp. 260 TaxID=2735314 RepID=UPI001490BCAB|nr:MFS transporter [Arthrobacter sp. 260]NOJ58673.1 MFS transporter [Arthrobacter sp. 260]
MTDHPARPVTGSEAEGEAANLRPLTIGIIAIITCAAFEAMAVTTAMPAVVADLDGVSGYGLAFSMYLTASLLGTVIAGTWCDRVGARPALAVGMFGMIAGLLVSGAAGEFWMVTAGRAVSGLGGGFMVVAVYVIIGGAYPQHRQPVIFGWLSAAWVLPSLIGPAVAGYLAAEASWRLVFLGVAPIVLAAFALVWPKTAALVPPEPGAGNRHDGRRRALTGLGLAGGVLAAQFAVNRLAAQEMADAAGAALLVALAVAGVIVAAVTLPRLLPKGTVRLAPGLPSIIATRGLVTAAFFGAEAFLPLMLVTSRGMDEATAGLSLSAGALGWSAGAFVQARVTFRRQWLLVIGASVLSMSIGLLALTSDPVVPFWVLVLVWTLAGFAMGMTLSSTSVLVLKLSPAQERGKNSSSLQLSDQLGGVVGTTIAGGLFALLRDPSDPGQVGVFVAIWLALCLFAVAGIVAGLRGALGSTDEPSAPAPRHP